MIKKRAHGEIVVPVRLLSVIRERSLKFRNGHVAKLVDAYASEAYGVTHGGSSPLVPTASKKDGLYPSFLLAERYWNERTRKPERAKASEAGSTAEPIGEDW